MKQLIISLCLLLPLTTNAQTIQNGKTVEYQGKNAKTPLAGVSIKVSDVEDVSKQDGSFRLVFHKLSKGDKIPIGQIFKSGYVIFNKDAYDEWRISSDNTPFVIILCKDVEFDRLVRIYYNISLNSYKSQYEKEWKEAEKYKTDKEKYERLLKDANDRYNSAIEQLQKHAETMARIDESAISQIEQEALDMVKTGKMQEAIRLMESLNISKELKRMAEKQAIGEQMILESKQDISTLSSKAKTLINIYQSNGGKENFDKCCQLYIDIADANLTNYDEVFDCAIFLHNQKKMKEAEKYYLIAKQIKNISQDQLAAILNNLGILHSSLKQYSVAEKEYNEALVIYREFATQNPEMYRSNIVEVLINLGNLHRELLRYLVAEEVYNEALVISRELVAQNPEVYRSDLASVLSELGLLYSDFGQYSAAEKKYNEALAIYREFATQNPDTYLGEVAFLLNRLGSLHSDLEQYSIAEKEYSEALVIRRALVIKNPDLYLNAVAGILNNLGILHSDLKQYFVAEKEYSEALVIRRKLADQNPIYRSDVAMILLNLANLHSNLKQYSIAEEEYSEALIIYREFASQNPDAYRKEIVSVLYNLGILRKNLKQHPVAEKED